MHAALVRTFDRPPSYELVEAPRAANETEIVVDVVAAGLHPRVRSQADGSHYTSTRELPLIPGIDGIGRCADGSLVYFVLPDTSQGSMAERTVIDTRRSLALPADADPIPLAAAMNPGMSSWVALKKRVAFAAGESVLVLGATGSAGQLAIQVAHHLGAGRIVAAGRSTGRLEALPALGADAVIDLAAAPDEVAAQLAAEASNVDVVLDYLWGQPTERAIMPLLLGRADPGKLLSWIQIGSVAGSNIRLPSAALRQANLHFLGSGQGSASATDILSTLPALVEAIDGGAFVIDTETRPLSEVETAWIQPTTGSGARVVLVP
ncbi:MAG: quinone oxidoreductase [Microbacteriaceae bacterium]|nr:quinone oxidoreductase [Microbacteriaceae bacterium]